MSDMSWGSAEHHKRVMVPMRSRRRCRQCDINVSPHRATHVGQANGVALMSGCEWSVRLWVNEQDDWILARYMLNG